MKKIIIIIAAIVILILAAAGLFIITFKIDEETIAVAPSTAPKLINEEQTVVWQKPLPHEQQILPTNEVIPTVTFNDSKNDGNMTFKKNHMEEQQERWKEKMNEPEFQKRIEQQQYQLLSSKYKSLIAYLNMSKEQKDAFLKIIIDRNISLRDLGIRIYGNTVHGIKENNKEQLIFLQKTYLSNMKELLGQEAYDVYFQYEAVEPEREKVQTAQSQLKDSGLALTTEQEDTLINAMYNARLKTDVYLFTNVGNWPEQNYLSDENKTKHIERMDILTENYLKEAEKILTTDQYSQFEQIIKQQNEHQKKAVNFISNR